MILNNNLEFSSQIVKIINSLIRDSNDSNLNLTIGVHNGKQVLQIGTAIKDKAIQVAERIIGIPQNSMLRIGDCGDQFGNDYSMLNCPQGSSVEKATDEYKKYQVKTISPVEKEYLETLKAISNKIDDKAKSE